MTDREKVIKGLKCCASMNGSACRECPYSSECVAGETTYQTGTAHLAADALELLKEQTEIVRCKDCKNWIAGYITDQDDFIPPKCGKYQQMVGHSSDDFCSLAERREKND